MHYSDGLLGVRAQPHRPQHDPLQARRQLAQCQGSGGCNQESVEPTNTSFLLDEVLIT